MTDIEKKRLQEVEEAVIRFAVIADVVLVDMKDRVRALEKRDNEQQANHQQACDNKSKEIDNKTNKVLVKAMAVSCGLFVLFVGAVVYFNGENKDMVSKKTASHRVMYAKMTKYHAETIETATNMKTVIKSLDKINDKLDGMELHKRVTNGTNRQH